MSYLTVSTSLVHFFFLTTKSELRMAVQSLNVDLSNAAICRLSCRGCVYEERPSEFSGFLSLENKRQGGRGGREEGASQSIGYFNHPCRAV